MSEISTDPAIAKLLEYVKDKKRITYDEMNELLPDSIVNSEKIEEVISLLEQKSITIMDDEPSMDEVNHEEDIEDDIDEDDLNDLDEEPIIVEGAVLPL